jgi:hypothetical protein
VDKKDIVAGCRIFGVVIADASHLDEMVMPARTGDMAIRDMSGEKSAAVYRKDEQKDGRQYESVSQMHFRMRISVP